MSFPKFPRTPPKLIPKRQATIPFRGQVAAGAYETLVSGRIMYGFRVIEVEMIFTEEAFNNIEYRWFVSTNTNAPTTDYPTDTNIFGRESPTAGFRGKAVIRTVPCNIEFPDGELHLKLAVFNAGNYAYQYNATMTVQEM